MNLKLANQDVAYVAIGSRNAPQAIVDTMRKLGARFAELGFTLRTTNNSNSEAAIYEGCKIRGGKAEVWTPWNSHQPDFVEDSFQPTTEAHIYCTKRTPGFDRMNTQSKAILASLANLMHGRNTEDSAKFVVCWSSDGCESDTERTQYTGEIGNVVSIATMSGIPVFNFGKEGAMRKLAPLVEDLKIRPTPDQIQAAFDSVRSDPFIAELESVFGITDAIVTPHIPEQLKIAA